MTHQYEEFQKYGKEQIDTATEATASFAKAVQAIASETADYSKKSFESGSAFVEKMFDAKSYDSAIQVQSEYWKSTYAGFITQATKMGELYSNLAKETFKPFEAAFAKLYSARS
jgi:hypothetical protein